MEEYIEHPLIVSETIQARVYQQILFAASIRENSLIILPTGLGKTIVFIMASAHYLKNSSTSKIVITAPTRPLVNQHYESCVEMLDISNDVIQILSGETSPDDRTALWNNGRVLIATPQTLRNDIVNGTCDLEAISLICFDEAHRAVGEDPYVLIAEQFALQNSKGRILGFTASPGKEEKLREIITNLQIQNIEYMDEEHPQVKPYIHEISEEWIWVQLPNELKEILDKLKEYTKSHLRTLKDLGLTNSIQIKNNPKRKLLSVPKKLNAERENYSDDDYYAGMISYGQLMLVTQASEILETQGIKTLHSYIQDKIDEFQRSNKSSLRRFLRAPEIKEVFEKTEQLLEDNFVHPKLTKLEEQIKLAINENPDGRILVFANYKATTQYLVEKLNDIKEISAHRFVGQSSSSYGKGLSQSQQKEVMEDFKEGKYNVLVSTSVGEEGLDVAQCDLVIFYDITPSSIRLIQRSGRTGRRRVGKVIMLITKGTRDEGYFYASRTKRNKISDTVKKIQNELENKSRGQEKNLTSFFQDGDNEDDKRVQEDIDNKTKKEMIEKDQHDQDKKQRENDPSQSKNQTNKIPTLEFESPDEILIYIDYRERGAGLIRKLMKENVNIKQENLEIGDFVLSTRVAIERKTARDFAQTMIRGELFDQLIQLKATYQKPILLIEGEDLYQSGPTPAAMRGALSSIIIDYSIPIVHTISPDETVEMLVTMAKREQQREDRKPTVRTSKPDDSQYEEQIYLLSSLPNINRVLAERILSKFKTPKKFFKASQDEMKKVFGIGPTTANQIDLLLSSPQIDDDEEKSL